MRQQQRQWVTGTFVWMLECHRWVGSGAVRPPVTSRTTCCSICGRRSWVRAVVPADGPTCRRAVAALWPDEE